MSEIAGEGEEQVVAIHQEEPVDATEVPAESENGEQEQEQEQEQEHADLSDPSVILAAMREVDQHTAAVQSVLRSFNSGFSNSKPIDYRGALEALQREENMIFTDIPSYVQIEIETDKEKNNRYNATIPSRTVAPRNPPIRDYSVPHKAYVSPQVPLTPPFNYQRFIEENPEWQSKAGTYHDLFYGDGSNCTFSPPEDNRRLQIEQERAVKNASPPQQDPPSYEPPPRRQLKVDSNFVPACAQIDHSAAQQELREKKALRAASRTRK